MANYSVECRLDESGWYVASVPEVPGCHTQGKTIEQVEERIREALALFIPANEAESATLTIDVQRP